MKNNPIDFLKEHWLWGYAICVVTTAGITSALASYLYISPRDYTIAEQKRLIENLEKHNFPITEKTEFSSGLAAARAFQESTNLPDHIDAKTKFHSILAGFFGVHFPLSLDTKDSASAELAKANAIKAYTLLGIAPDIYMPFFTVENIPRPALRTFVWPVMKEHVTRTLGEEAGYALEFGVLLALVNSVLRYPEANDSTAVHGALNHTRERFPDLKAAASGAMLPTEITLKLDELGFLIFRQEESEIFQKCLDIMDFLSSRLLMPEVAENYLSKTS